jgi:hypothetical protein
MQTRKRLVAADADHQLVFAAAGRYLIPAGQAGVFTQLDIVGKIIYVLAISADVDQVEWLFPALLNFRWVIQQLG